MVKQKTYLLNFYNQALAGTHFFFKNSEQVQIFMYYKTEHDYFQDYELQQNPKLAQTHQFV